MRFQAMLFLLLVTLFVGCSKDAPRPKAANAPAAPTKMNGADQLEGTGDGGGGNTLNGKPLDTYAFDVTKNQIWINYFAATFANDSDLANMNTWLSLWKSRVWYMVPTSLKKLPADRIGAANLEQATDQAALHTDSREIWIDENEFKNLKSDDERATLLLHEFIMGLTTISLSSANSICVDYADILHSKIESCGQLSKKGFGGLETAYPASKLTKEHYAFIRNTTDELFQKILQSKNRKLTANQLLVLYFKKHFSPQFFPEPVEQESLSNDQLAFISRTMLARLDQFLPVCHVKMEDSSIKKVPCKISIEIRESSAKKEESFIEIDTEVDGKKLSVEYPVEVGMGIAFKNMIHDGLTVFELSASAPSASEGTNAPSKTLYRIYSNEANGLGTVEFLRPLGKMGVSFSVSNSQDIEAAKKPITGQFDNLWPSESETKK